MEQAVNTHGCCGILGFLQGQVSPRINAIGTFVFMTSMTLVILAQLLLMKRATAPGLVAGDKE